MTFSKGDSTIKLCKGFFLYKMLSEGKKTTKKKKTALIMKYM